MKKGVSLLVVLVFSAMVLAACAGPMGQRTTQGALLGGIIGAAAGGVLGGGKGAAAGGLIGAGIGGIAGAAIGAKEEQTIYSEPQPLPWLSGKSIQVVGSRSYGYGVDVSRAVVEDQLRRRGAVVVDGPGPQYYPTGQPVATDFIAEVGAIERYNSVLLDIRVLDASRQVRAIGSAAVYWCTMVQTATATPATTGWRRCGPRRKMRFGPSTRSIPRGFRASIATQLCPLGNFFISTVLFPSLFTIVNKLGKSGC